MTTETKGVQRPLTSRQKAKQKTRTLILGAAQEMFSHHGYDAVTIRDLASKIGRSTGSIFACYPDKAALFEAAMGEPAPDVEKWLGEFRGRMEGVIGEDDTITLLLTLANEAEHLRRILRGNHS